MNLPLPENTPEINRAEKTRTLLNWITFSIILFIAVGVIATLYFRWGDSAQQSTTQHGVDAIVQSARRADCARAYNALFVDIDRAQRIAAADGQIALGRYLIGDPAITPEALRDLGAKVDAANAEMKRLPSVNSAVSNGFKLDGKTYPPCPVVK